MIGAVMAGFVSTQAIAMVANAIVWLALSPGQQVLALIRSTSIEVLGT
jgi:hypothetical protein